MRVLVIGGTRFVGFAAVERLVARGHDVLLVHRGNTVLPEPLQVREIHCDRANIADRAAEIKSFAPEVLLDVYAYTEGDAQTTLAAIGDFIPRAVVISSQDAYRAYARLIRSEPGSPDPVPLTEDSPLREQPITDKIKPHFKPGMERAYLSDTRLTTTVLRLPPVFGPRDFLRRFDELVQPMNAGHPFVRIQRESMHWRWTREYIDNVGDAIALATESKPTKGAVYNLGEDHAITELEWAQSIAEAMNYKGELILTPCAQMPNEEGFDGDFSQDLVMDTTRFRADFNWTPSVSREIGLRRTIQWLIKTGSLPKLEPGSEIGAIPEE